LPSSGGVTMNSFINKTLAWECSWKCEQEVICPNFMTRCSANEEDMETKVVVRESSKICEQGVFCTNCEPLQSNASGKGSWQYGNLVRHVSMK
jgi:hypothetical protein